MPQPKKTLYEILGVSRDAEAIEVGLAYEKRSAELQRAVPPDPGAESLLHEAFEVLRDPRRRAAYDASLVTAAERAAAAQQAEPDLLLDEDTDERKPRTVLWIALAAGALVVVAGLYFALRPGPAEPPKAAAVEAPAPPPPPPPPKKLAAADVLRLAAASSGQLLSIEMSGRATPIGLAVAVEPNAMVSTCHGIQAGRKLVVTVGADTHAAELVLTDEQLDLCRLAVPGLNAQPPAIAADTPRAGEPIFATGVNDAGVFAVTEGTVRKLVNAPAGQALDLSVPIAPRGSGGGVFDAYGRLVGIATASHRLGANLNIALPAIWVADIRTRGRSS